MSRAGAVWITGVGTANPLGVDFETTAANLLAGRSGVVPVPELDFPDHLSKIAGRVAQVPAPPGLAAADFAGCTRLEQLFLWSGFQALRSAGLEPGLGGRPAGLVLGLGGEWMYQWDVDHQRGGGRLCDPAQDTRSVADLVQAACGLTGPAATVAAACASGNYALAQARAWIRLGWVDVCLAGAGDMFILPLPMACFGNLRALSKRNGDPPRASRPFDRDRDGFVMGEGGVVFVLESAAHARARGAEPLAELAGFGASSDAFHMVIPSPSPDPAISAMRAALADARVNPEDVDYVNAHATSTPAGDVAETKVVQAVLGPRSLDTPVSSTKSMTGHLLSGAAALNALACLVALRRQALPPTINLDNIDPDCTLCHVPNEARDHPVRVAVSNSLGFGGSNTTVVLRQAA